MAESAAMVLERISRFLTDPRSGSFEELALEAFAFQYARVAPYRRLAEARGITPESVDSWQQIPLVPATAFRSLELAAAPAALIFRSSGTTAGTEARSVHHHPYPELYRTAIDSSFPAFCLPAGTGGTVLPSILSLIPGRELLPDSSLSFMADHLLARWGGPASAAACGPRGVEAAPARSWAGARQREGRPVVILATALALLQWLEALERQELRFRLPAGTVIFETGGFKGRTTEIAREELVRRVEERLGVPASGIVREYGMTELTSQCYTRALAGGDPDLFVTPHWMRARILDPLSLAPAAPGEPGLIALFDLANLGSAVHLLTEDLGVREGDGFRLLGRAAGADLRGCSLAAEELQGASRPAS